MLRIEFDSNSSAEYSWGGGGGGETCMNVHYFSFLPSNPIHQQLDHINFLFNG